MAAERRDPFAVQRAQALENLRAASLAVRDSPYLLAGRKAELYKRTTGAGDALRVVKDLPTIKALEAEVAAIKQEAEHVPGSGVLAEQRAKIIKAATNYYASKTASLKAQATKYRADKMAAKVMEAQTKASESVSKSKTRKYVTIGLVGLGLLVAWRLLLGKPKL